jgi:two-component system, NtrC family, C4-dicarboxylate transport response regulator DctD
LQPASLFIGARRHAACNRRGMSLGRLLLVDDEPTLRRVIGRALVKAGFEVVEAANGRAALEALADERFDAVISDVRMPRMGGLEFLQRLLRDEPDMPVVLMSGSHEVQNATAALELGAFDYLQKPLVLADLQRSALRAVQAHERRRFGRRCEVA